MSRRLRGAERLIVLTFAVLAVLALPFTGPALLLAAGAGGFAFLAISPLIAARERPEHLSGLIFVIGELVLAGGILGSHGPRMLMLPVLAGPALMVSAVWPLRGMLAAIGATALLIVAVGLAIDARALWMSPTDVIFPVAVLISCGLVTSTARAADVASRAAAAVDRLTGLLNRAALLPRAQELAHQAQISGESAAVLIADLDHFKQVNDEHGHAAGDRVLAELAGRLRRELGGEGTLYRFGGEELVALVPGIDLLTAAKVAERLRHAVEAEPVSDLPLSISLGVAASRKGESFDFEALFALADDALYRAKQSGRNRVCVGSAKAAGEPVAVGATAQEGRRRGRRSGVTSLPPARSELDAIEPLQSASIAQPADGGADRLPKGVLTERDPNGSWLAPDEAARVHTLDLIDRIKGVRLQAYGVVFLALLAGVGQYGWLVLAPPALAAIFMGVAIELVRRMRRPELAIAGTVVAAQVANAGAFLFAHNRPYGALSLLVTMVCAWSPMFPRRAVAIGAALEALLIVLAGAYIGGSDAFADPVTLGVPLAVLVSVAAIGSALGRSAVAHRGTAVVDPLTGMLSRHALHARVAAIANQVAYSHEPVGLIVGDIDHFKSINDRSGHRTGDAVLHEVAARMCKQMRAFESAYRLGGEEFVVLLVGPGAAEAEALAGRLRSAVAEQPIDGLPVTMSLGVAHCAPPECFDYQALFARADDALYAAKRGGRDQIVVAGRSREAPATPAQATAA